MVIHESEGQGSLHRRAYIKLINDQHTTFCNPSYELTFGCEHNNTLIACASFWLHPATYRATVNCVRQKFAPMKVSAGASANYTLPKKWQHL